MILDKAHLGGKIKFILDYPALKMFVGGYKSSNYFYVRSEIKIVTRVKILKDFNMKITLC